MSRSGFEPENDVSDIRFASLVRLKRAILVAVVLSKELDDEQLQRNGGTAVGQARMRRSFTAEMDSTLL